jgi:hypothetical protein
MNTDKANRWLSAKPMAAQNVKGQLKRLTVLYATIIAAIKPFKTLYDWLTKL